MGNPYSCSGTGWLRLLFKVVQEEIQQIQEDLSMSLHMVFLKVTMAHHTEDWEIRFPGKQAL
jgi:hypothetical protein